MIKITKSPNADSRTATSSSTEDLKAATESHISDVAQAIRFICDLLTERGKDHDHTKLENIDEFSAALNSGHIKDTKWYQMHVTEERHHLKANVPDDVTLIDVIECLADCVMAGLARSGEVYDVDIDSAVLQLAVKNTVELLISNTKVVEADSDMADELIDD